MEESVRPEPAARPARSRPRLDDPDDGPPLPPHLAASHTLTILTTEHWSLLMARSLAYNEAFSRGAMFLTFLSASLIALGFVLGAVGPERGIVVIAILALDLFVGIATLGRLAGAGTEEARAMQGMARLRHAYLELAPQLEPYFVSPRHDDIGSVMADYTVPGSARVPIEDVLHGLTSMPGLVGVVDSAVAGALVAVVSVALGASPLVGVLLGVVAGIAAMVLFVAAAGMVYRRQGRKLSPRFPAPDQPSRRRT